MKKMGLQKPIILSLPEIVFKIENKTGDCKWGE
jgi:hypothetical protein